VRFLRENSLSIVFGVLFLAALVGQSVAGYFEYNEQQRVHMQPPLSYPGYLFSADFGQSVLENWQSEYLQFALFIVATVWLVQRGSPDSKELERRGRETDEEQRVGRFADEHSPVAARVGGLRLRVYQHSLFLTMIGIFFVSWIVQSLDGWSSYNQDLAEHRLPAVGWLGYVGSSTFWESTLQNWQSEFLVIGSVAVFAIYLRERGAAGSKPVGAARDETGSEG
jgi:hypothetical protein